MNFCVIKISPTNVILFLPISSSSNRLEIITINLLDLDLSFIQNHHPIFRLIKQSSSMKVPRLQFSSVSYIKSALFNFSMLKRLYFSLGNISEKVPDAMIKKIVAACGPVANWKRVSTFGFCEFE
jgi:hypothetical protein